MAIIILTTASVSPWTAPAGFTTLNHSVQLLSAGANGGTGTTGGVNPQGGVGGGGGAWCRLAYSAGTITAGVTTIPFQVGVGNGGATTGRSIWESSVSSVANYYFAEGAVGITGGTPAFNTNGTPTITYTNSGTNVGGNGGAVGGTNRGGGGGGGAGGQTGVGAAGGAPIASAGGGSGGGGSNGGAIGGNAQTGTFAAGGNGNAIIRIKTFNF